jgi:hypothetical protein
MELHQSINQTQEELMYTAAEERTNNSELRQLINNAIYRGELRASDCRHALKLQAAGMPPSMLLDYIRAMIQYTAKTRTPTQENKQ